MSVACLYLHKGTRQPARNPSPESMGGNGTEKSVDCKAAPRLRAIPARPAFDGARAVLLTQIFILQSLKFTSSSAPACGPRNSYLVPLHFTAPPNRRGAMNAEWRRSNRIARTSRATAVRRDGWAHGLLKL